MTCIVGLKHGKKIFIGGDSAAVCGYEVTPRKDAKVFVRDGVAFGCAGSFRMRDLVRYSLEIPELRRGENLNEYMCVDFVDSLRACFTAGGHMRKDNEQERGACLLVGIRGRLFHIAWDYQVGENSAPYSAIGCADQIALGAMTQLVPLGKGVTPERAIRRALSAAALFNGGVCAPFKVVSA